MNAIDRDVEPSAAPRTVDARELLADAKTAHLVLDGQVYILRLTRAGKLILTK
ncbi:MAG: hemin uptake protein HemP [Pseudomonadota bacterium]